jgi:hypothetical protein
MSETPISQNSDRVEARKLLLDFYSTEIESHSNLIIGLALVLLAILEFFPKQHNGTYIFNVPTWMGVIIIWFISGSLWYFLMRHFAYGILCNATITISIKDYQIEPLVVTRLARDYAHKYSKVLLVFPSSLFIRGDSDVTLFGRQVKSKWAMRLGSVVCYVGFGTVTMFLLLLLIGVIKI